MLIQLILFFQVEKALISWNDPFPVTSDQFNASLHLQKINKQKINKQKKIAKINKQTN